MFENSIINKWDLLKNSYYSMKHQKKKAEVKQKKFLTLLILKIIYLNQSMLRLYQICKNILEQIRVG